MNSDESIDSAFSVFSFSIFSSFDFLVSQLFSSINFLHQRTFDINQLNSSLVQLLRLLVLFTRLLAEMFQIALDKSVCHNVVTFYL